jgi:predicted Zn-dependent protease
MNKIGGMIYGENPRQGFARDGMFYHPDLRFSFDYPDSWNIINQPTLVAAVNEEQDAVSVMRIDSESDSPRSSVISYVSQDGFTVESQNDTQHNGLNGYEAVALATAEDGTNYRFYVYAVSYDENIYRFTSYSVADKFAAYRPQFEETSNSFAELNDQKILNIEPVRLQTFRAERTDTFSSFLPQSLPMDIKAEDIAIVNQVELDDTIEKGTWLKIPRQ